MTEYRLYFLDEKGAIEAREDFVAADDDAALVVSDVVCRGCSDLCIAYELWQGMRLVMRVDRPGANLAVPMDGQASAAQEIALKVEENLQVSRWRIAQSLKLIEETERLRKRLASQ